VHVDRARAARILLSPHAVEQHVTRDDETRVRHEEREQVELLGGQLDRLAGDGDVVRLLVEHHVAEREGAVALLRLRPAEDRLHPRDELARRERLGQIVVGADLEPDDAIGLLVARGEHEDRHLRAHADVAADLEAVLARQADVEQHHPDLVALELDERLLAGPHPDDAVAVAREVAADELSDRGLVFDEENGPRHCPPKGIRRTWRARGRRGRRRSASPRRSSCA
jgi:hypothetical protein